MLKLEKLPTDTQHTNETQLGKVQIQQIKHS